MLHANSLSRNTLRRKADRLTRDALARWVCADLDRATTANEALALYELSRIADYSDDLGHETFTVRDASAPDGAFLCGREWCCCDPRREEAPTCRHSLAVGLLLGYRSHYARLHAAAPLRVMALVAKPVTANPLTVRESMNSLQAKLAAGGAQ